MDLTEAEDIKRWQEYTEELYKRNLHDPDNHDGVIRQTREEPLLVTTREKPAQQRGPSIEPPQKQTQLGDDLQHK